MKRILALFLFSLTAGAQSPSTVTFNWNYAYSEAYPVCTAQVTTNCIKSFTLAEGSTSVATVPATAETSYTYTLPSLPSVGNHTYTLVATAAYQGGTINSLPATVSLQVPGTPATPGSFTVVLR